MTLRWKPLLLWLAACAALAMCFACTSIETFDYAISSAENSRDILKANFLAAPASDRLAAWFPICGHAIDHLTDSIFAARQQIGAGGSHKLAKKDLDKRRKDAEIVCGQPSQKP